MKNLRCKIAYTGTHYYGFQKTRTGPSIEETLEKALVQILQHPVKIQAASRTDRGVHAKGQIINFFTNKGNRLDLLSKRLGALLPPDITLEELVEVGGTFHPSLDARGKLYTYEICNQPFQLPFHREYSWHVPVPLLDLKKMRQGAAALVGEHDFSAFTSECYDNPIRVIHSITLQPLEEGRLEIEVSGKSFLYKMVRNIVGTLVQVGQGKIPFQSLEEILLSKQRAQAGVSAPAHGLVLKEVFY